MIGRSIVVLLAVLVAVASAVWALPVPDPSVTFDCPNFDSVRVHRVDWPTRSNVYVRTIPATCGDTSAITFGYLGD